MIHSCAILKNLAYRTAHQTEFIRIYQWPGLLTNSVSISFNSFNSSYFFLATHVAHNLYASEEQTIRSQ